MPPVVDPVGAGLAAVLAVAYLALVRRHRRQGSWPWWRAGLFVLGALVLAVGCLLPAGVSTLWVEALGLSLVLAVAPVLLALGDPLRLVEQTRGRSLRLLHSRPARWVMFPAVGSLVAALVTVWALTSGWWDAALRSVGARVGLDLLLLSLGLLVTLPLLTDELLPAWCGPGLRVLLAACDGLLDAVPGVVVMTSAVVVVHGYTRPEQQLAGGAFLATAEVIALPMLVAVVARWVRQEDLATARVDAELDARQEPEESATGEHPWWLDDPRLAGRGYLRPPDGPGPTPTAQER